MVALASAEPMTTTMHLPSRHSSFSVRTLGMAFVSAESEESEEPPDTMPLIHHQRCPFVLLFLPAPP